MQSRYSIDIGICSLIGGISVSCTQALGACILTTIRGENQVSSYHWHCCYPLLTTFAVQKLVHIFLADLSHCDIAYVFIFINSNH